MYRGTFKDINNSEYTVELIPKGTEGHVEEITLSANPVTISRKSETLFTELKPLGCTIEIVTDKILPDLYSDNLKDVEVNIYYQSVKIFSGYVTPYIYNQPYASMLDTLQIEAVSKLSILKDVDYKPINGINNKQIVDFREIIWNILINGAGYSKDDLKIAYKLGTNQNLTDFKISESNFFDDDENKTPWKMDEVLTHICRYIGASIVEYEDDWIYILDYQQVANSTNFMYHYFGMLNQTPSGIVKSKCAVCGYTVDYYDIPQQCSRCGQRGTMQKVEPSLGEASISNNGYDLTRTVTKDDYASNDSVVSFDEIYNKAEVEVNAYKLDDIFPDVYDEKNSHHAVSYMGNAGISTYSWKHSDTITHRLYVTTKLMNTNSNWKHRYYRMSNGTELTTYGNIYESDYAGSEYNMMSIPQINTRCAVIRQVAKDKLGDPKPAKLDFEDYIAFYCLDDTTAPHGDYNFSWRVKNGNITDSSGNIRTSVEQPVLEYTSDIPVKWCPESGTSWITIKGDLWYQQNIAGTKTTLYITDIDNKLYAQFPVDGIVDEPAYIPWVSTSMSNNGTFYTEGKNSTRMWMAERDKTMTDYGKGFPMLKCSLQIGDYYWDADYQGWTTQPATFYINYNNNPSGDTKETFACLQWQTIAPNHTYEDKIGENCWAIPIKESVDGHKVTGKVKFTLYTPSQLGPLYDRWSHGTNWQVLFPVIYMKGFELNYVYTDDTNWWQPSEEKDDDIVYSNTVSAGFNREHDAVEFKVNSYSDDVPISRSFVLNSDNTFMTNVTNGDTGFTYNMEKHYIEKLINHYKSPKLILETSVNYVNPKSYERFDPRVKHYIDFESINTFKNDEDNKTFLVDSFEINCKENTAKVKYIEW
jgi:hypothetical protein